MNLNLDRVAAEQRRPNKTPLPWLVATLVIFGLIVMGVTVLLPSPSEGTPESRTALLVGLAGSGFGALITLTMRSLRPPILILQDDGIYLPRYPKEGWQVAF